MSDKVAAELVARCFAARTHAHALHLATKSFAEHSALGTFYDEITSLTDTFAETYQGMIDGRLSVPFEVVKPSTSAEQLINSLREWIDANRDEIGSPPDTHIQNIIDEIRQLIDQTCYRLSLK